MKKYTFSFLLSLYLLFTSVVPSYAAVLYSNDFTSSFSGFWQFFGTCSPGSEGLTCGSGANLVYSTPVNNLKCIYGDFTALGLYSDPTGTPELHLWENANESSLGVGAIFYISNSITGATFKMADYPTGPTLDSGVNPPSMGLHTYGLCKNGDVYKAYVDGVVVQTETFTGRNPNQIAFNMPYETTLTNFYATDVLPSPTNMAPIVSSISGAVINAGGTYSTSGSFTDTDSTTWNATVNYGDGSGAQELSLNTNKTFNLNHVYNTSGTYTVTVKVTDDPGASGIQTTTVTVGSQLTSLDPAQVYINKALLNLGVKFDLKAEVYKDSSLVSSGQLNSVNPGVNPTLFSIPFNSFSPVTFSSGSALKVTVYARNACTGSLLNSGTATLSYNASSVDSRFGATIGASTSTYHLLNGFVLGTTSGASQQSVSVAAGARCSAFKSFGTWTITP